MASLSNTKIKDTYQSLVKFSDNGNITIGAKRLTDGFGNNSPLYVSTTQIGIGVTPTLGYDLHVNSNTKIGGNLEVGGNLTVSGTLTYIDVEDLATEDPLIKLARNNTDNLLDIGFYGKYIESTVTKYKGLYNDADDDKWKLFIGTSDEPTTVVNTGGTGYTVGTLVANLEGNVTGGTISGTTGTFSGDLSANNLSGTNTGDQTLPTDFVSKANGGTFGGSVTATGFSGPLTGNVTGNVIGNVTGNLTGDVTGNITGSSYLNTIAYQGGEGTELDNSAFNVDGIGTNFRWIESNSGSTGSTWKKVADVVITNAITPNGVQLEAKVYQPNTNSGVTAGLHTVYYSVAFRGRIDDSSTHNDAIVYGKDADLLRVYKTADYTFELQARSNDDNRDLVVECNITSKKGGKVTPTTTYVDGTITGGTAYTASGNALNKTKFAGNVEFEGAIFDSAEVEDLRVNELLYFGSGATSGYGPHIQHSDSGGTGKGMRITVDSDLQVWGVTGNAGEQNQGLYVAGGVAKLYDLNGVVLETVLGGVDITGTLEVSGTITGDVTGNLTGDVTGDLTGSVTGAASLNVLKTGDTMTGDLLIADDSELTFGDSSDLKIYHTTNNIVRINSGDLIFNSFVTDGDIKFQLDNGSGSLTEYMRLDGGTQTIPFGRSPHIVDNLKLYFGNDTVNDASIKWDSTASQLFISGESKFLNDLYCVGDVNVANNIFSEGLYVNSNSAVSGTQVAIVKQDDSTNLQRWGTANSGQDSYRFRIDQDMKFIANSGSGDNLTIFSDTGNLTTIGQITAVQSTFTRGSSDYAIRLDSSASTVDNDLRFAKGGTDYGAIQTNADTTHNFEFFVNDGTNWLSTLYFDRTYGTTEVTKALRVGGDSAIATGVGLELRYVSALNESRVLSYDRGNSAYKGLRLIASSIDFETSGSIFSKFNHTFSYISNSDSGNFAYPNLGGRLLTSNGTNWDADGRDPILTLSSSGNSDSTEIANSIGLNLYSNSNDDDTFSPAIAFSGLSNSTSYASAYGLIIGKKTGQANDSNWNAGELQFYTGKVGAYMSNVPDLRIDSAGNAYFAASITVAGGTVFNSNITVQGNLTVDGTTLLKSNTKITNTGDVEYLTLNTTSTTSKRVRLQFTQNDNAGVEIGTDLSVNNGTNFYFYDRTGGGLMAYFASDKSYLPTNSKLGIGTDSPTRGLTIAKSNEYASLEIIKSNSGNQIVYLGTGSSGAGENPILQLKEGTVEKVRLYATGDSWIDGGNLGVGTGSAIDSKLHVQNGSAGSVSAYANTTLTLESSATDNFLSFLSPAGENQGILFGDADANWRGQVRYDHGTDAMQFYTAATSALTINSSQDATFTGNVTADYGFFNAESLTQNLRVGGIYANLGLYVPDTYDMQFAIGTTASNWKFTLANITKFLITPNGDVTANGSGTFGSTLTVSSPSSYSGSTFRMQTATGSSSYYLDFKPADEGASGITWEMHQQTGGSAYANTLKFIQGRTGLGKSPDSAYRLDVNGLSQVVGGINLVATTSTLYATDGALSYYSASNGVYLNGAGASGWLRLNASGVENDQNSINIYGSAGNYMNFRTANSTRLLIDANGDFQASVDLDKNYEFGKAHIGYMGHADHAGFSHIDCNATGTYALLQSAIGTTYLNAASGQKVRIRQNNLDYQTFYQTNFGLNNTNPQFWIHSGTTVAIPNSRYLNFAGTSNTEIAQSGFRQAFVCSYNDSTATSQPKNIGIILHNESTQDNNFTPMLAFGAQSNSTNYSQVVAGIAGKRLGQVGDSNWSAGELWFWTGRSDTISGTNQGLPAQNPAMIMTSTRQIAIATTSPASGVKLDVQDQALINSLGFNANRINSGYATAANDADIWINYEGYLNGNSYYRDFRVGNGRNGQIMHWDGDTSRVAIGESASTNTARFQVLNNGGNGSIGDADYGILAKASSAGNQATIGAIHASTGHANLNLGNNDGGLKFWHISKRLSGDAHRLEIFYYDGSFASKFQFQTGGNFSATGSITASGDVIAFSDKKVKTNIKTIDNALEKVSKLRGVSYNRTDIDDKSDKIGVIAQEVKEVLPEVVSYDDEKDLLGVDYGKMAGVFIEAIKELKAEVNSLKQEIKELKK